MMMEMAVSSDVAVITDANSVQQVLPVPTCRKLQWINQIWLKQ